MIVRECTDLFGELLIKRVSEARRRPVRRNGYAAAPGTGPAGETCASCAQARRFGQYAKCALLERHWTGGQGTDVLLRSPACRLWESTAGKSASAQRGTCDASAK
ncbi:hypothetical protein DX980_20455 (plasmid) [Burkholderia gladioli]|uniref:hypothetical protein n=1 Tax=Burkholderia gladioli TaxID=28095 RepID=UPI001364D5A1|nr:hypothetical protein [Burkholderia gladioli]KAF1060729.1 hypothetical protein LvStA_04004 [Burkholderia gladioli]WAG21673.1 hypothetical protein DX980_20455 [Burkholderia gladioli]